MNEKAKTIREQMDQHLRMITTWAIMLEVIDRTQGDDITIPNHALGEVGRAIIRESTALQELLSDLNPSN